MRSTGMNAWLARGFFPIIKSQFQTSGAAVVGNNTTQAQNSLGVRKASLRPILKSQEEQGNPSMPQTPHVCADLGMEKLHRVLSGLTRPLDIIINIPMHLLCWILVF